MDIAKYNSPLNTLGGISGEGVMGGHKCKSGKAAKRLDRLAPNLVTSVDSSVNGHRLKTIGPTIPQDAFLWSNGWTEWEYILHIKMQVNLGMDTG